MPVATRHLHSRALRGRPLAKRAVLGPATSFAMTHPRVVAGFRYAAGSAAGNRGIR
jgi:hypothetical protein